jgi:hypothetical protein
MSLIQPSLAIEQCAQENNLGAFQKAYAEFPSPFFVLLQSILLGAMALAWIWIVPLLAQTISLWVAVTLGILIVLFLLWAVVFVWRGYAAKKGRWLYLYSAGFVYDSQGHIQGYRLEEILSVDTHETISSNGNSTIFYTLNLVTGEHLKIEHGAELKSRLREH